MNKTNFIEYLQQFKASKLNAGEVFDVMDEFLEQRKALFSLKADTQSIFKSAFEAEPQNLKVPGGHFRGRRSAFAAHETAFVKGNADDIGLFAANNALINL